MRSWANVGRTLLALALALVVTSVWSSAQRSNTPIDSASDSQEPDGPAQPAAPGIATRVVVIDPGHGGSENGVVGPGNVQEKTLTLEVARRVKALVESRLGVRALLTREDDRDVSLDQRASLANGARADLFVSLHFNASTSPTMSGSEIYLLKVEPPSGEDTDPPSLVLPLARGGARTVTFVPWSQAQARHQQSATRLADLLVASLRERVPLSPRPLVEAPMRLLAGLDMPAVLLELAYLTNPEQASAAQSEEFQAGVADAVAGAIGGYRATQGAGRTP